MNKYKLIFLLIFANYSAFSANLELNSKFIHALGEVESGNKTNLIGDNGKAIGIFQIHYLCWKDATDFDKTIKGKYSDCFSKDYSIKILTAYLNRYCRKEILSNNYEALARVWNSGPQWKNKISLTNNYWSKVKRFLNER